MLRTRVPSTLRVPSLASRTHAARYILARGPPRFSAARTRFTSHTLLDVSVRTSSSQQFNSRRSRLVHLHRCSWMARIVHRFRAVRRHKAHRIKVSFLTSCAVQKTLIFVVWGEFAKVAVAVQMHSIRPLVLEFKIFMISLLLIGVWIASRDETTQMERVTSWGLVLVSGLAVLMPC